MAGLVVWGLKRHYKNNALVSDVLKISNVITSDSLFVYNIRKSHMRTAVLYFSTDCDYCKKEIEGILSCWNECKNVQWVFYTLATQDELDNFTKEYPIENIPDSFIIREDYPDLYLKLKFTSPPSLYIYDKNGKISRMYKGATSVNKIVEDLQ